MPELPEVETFKRYLDKTSLNQVIKDTKVNDTRILDVDYSKNVPRDNFRRHPKLPSVYTKEEITSMIEVIDRGNPKGKRDYAIILIATRLGLRSSDICNIKFENLNWKQCEIAISQQKTRQEVILPLTTEIGT